MNGHDGAEKKLRNFHAYVKSISLILFYPSQLPVLHSFFLFMWQLHKTTHSRRLLIQFACADKDSNYKNLHSPLGAKVNSTSESHV